jgi:hypothetical protein
MSRESEAACELREPPSFYGHDFAGEKEGLSEKNTYFWDNYDEISRE